MDANLFPSDAANKSSIFAGGFQSLESGILDDILSR